MVVQLDDLGGRLLDHQVDVPYPVARIVRLEQVLLICYRAFNLKLITSYKSCAHLWVQEYVFLVGLQERLILNNFKFT